MLTGVATPARAEQRQAEVVARLEVGRIARVMPPPASRSRAMTRRVPASGHVSATARRPAAFESRGCAGSARDRRDTSTSPRAAGPPTHRPARPPPHRPPTSPSIVTFRGFGWVPSSAFDAGVRSNVFSVWTRAVCPVASSSSNVTGASVRFSSVARQTSRGDKLTLRSSTRLDPDAL